MGMILSYTASCGASVNFSDDGYINSSEQELVCCRENMRSTAEQIAQELQLRQLRGDLRSSREMPEPELRQAEQAVSDNFTLNVTPLFPEIN